MIFSQHDLAWIDNILPEKDKKETDKKKKRKKEVHETSEEEVAVVSGRAEDGDRETRFCQDEGWLCGWSWVLRPRAFLKKSSGWSELVS